MAISRPLLIALIAVLVLFAGVTAMRMFGGEEEASSAAPASSQSTASAAASPASASADSSTASSSATVKPAAGGPAPGSGASARPRRQKANVGAADDVARALAGRKTVILFFGARGWDDRVTRQAARTVRDEKVAVFTDSVYRLDDYTRLVGVLPLTQVPATVIIAPDRTARVVEGFADAGTLRQLVADAR